MLGLPWDVNQRTLNLKAILGILLVKALFSAFWNAKRKPLFCFCNFSTAVIYISCGCVHNHYKILVHKLVNPSNLWDLREKRNLTCLSKIYEVYHNMNYLVVQVWPCFLNKCKNGFQTCVFSTIAHLEIEIWIITHANPRESMGGCIFARLSDFLFCLGITRPWLNVYLKVTNVCLHAKATNTFDTWLKHTWKQYLNS